MDFVGIKKALLKVWIFIGGGAALSACQTVELVFYEHEPSQKFYQNLSIEDQSLKPFIEDGVLFTLSLKAVNQRSDYIVWQGLYTKEENKEVLIEKAIIRGGAWSHEETLNKRVDLSEKFEGGKFLKTSVKLFQLDAAALKKAYGGNGPIEVKVFYEINGRAGVMEYELKRRVEKQTVFQT